MTIDSNELVCAECAKEQGHTQELKVCKKCGASSDKDPLTRKYCRKCAKKLGVCRICGKKLEK